MRLVRTLLAFAIAVSLAMLPIGASAAGVAMAAGDMQMQDAQIQDLQMQVAGHADMSMDECCPDGMKGTTSHTDGYKCAMGFCCIGGALALSDIRPIGFESLALAASKMAIPTDQVASFRRGSPPFRPPRI